MSDSKYFTFKSIFDVLTTQFFQSLKSGKTVGNQQWKVQGHTDSPLNQEGQEQADKLGKVLMDFQFDQAFSSDLSRAKETCQRILSANSSSKINIIETELLREKCFGEAEDLHYLQFAYVSSFLKKLNVIIHLLLWLYQIFLN